MQYIKRQFYFPEKPGMQKRFYENTKIGKKEILVGKPQHNKYRTRQQSHLNLS